MSIPSQDPHFYDSLKPRTINEKIVWGALNPAQPQWQLAHKIGLIVGAVAFTLVTAGLGLFWIMRISRTFSAYQTKINNQMRAAATTANILPSIAKLPKKADSIIFPHLSKDKVTACIQTSLLTPQWKLNAANWKGETLLLDFAKGTDLPSSPPEVREFAARPIPLPLPFDTEAYEKAKARMVAAPSDEFTRAIVRKTTDSLLHITLPLMEEKLSACIREANAHLAGRAYGASVLGEKSNEWMLQIALRLGLQPPQEIQTIDPIPKAIKILSTDTIVLIDDASYSGKQIIEQIASQFRKGFTKEIVVIIPFISKAATEKIKQREKELGIPIKIITSDITLPTYQEVLGNEEEIARFKRLAGMPYHSANVLAFTDWRRPDAFSSPEWFFKGCLMGVDPIEPEPAPLVPDLKRIYSYKPIHTA